MVTYLPMSDINRNLHLYTGYLFDKKYSSRNGFTSKAWAEESEKEKKNI